ncbi:hypothetical protein QNN88_10225 [Citrobacter sp. ANG330]|uniref:hypothetical protein n=1 Tax=Citrobacter sp. ANG330 TaxID=3048142 RepID=UPI0039C06E0A
MPGLSSVSYPSNLTNMVKSVHDDIKSTKKPHVSFSDTKTINRAVSDHLKQKKNLQSDDLEKIKNYVFDLIKTVKTQGSDVEEKKTEQLHKALDKLYGQPGFSHRNYKRYEVTLKNQKTQAVIDKKQEELDGLQKKYHEGLSELTNSLKAISEKGKTSNSRTAQDDGRIAERCLSGNTDVSMLGQLKNISSNFTKLTTTTSDEGGILGGERVFVQAKKTPVLTERGERWRKLEDKATDLKQLKDQISKNKKIIAKNKNDLAEIAPLYQGSNNINSREYLKFKIA